MKLVRRLLKSLGKKKNSYVLPAGQGGMRSGKAWWSWKEGVRTKSQETQMLSKRQEVFQNAIEGKLGVQSRANEILHDQIIEELKEVEHKKTEAALNLVSKETDLWRYRNEREEAKRSQGARKFKKDEEMGAPPRNKSDWPDWEEARSAEKKKRGGWSERGKRRCQRSLSCRMRSEAPKWTLMVKATANMQKQKFLEEKEKHQTKRVRRSKKSEKEK